jgi:hypothetical protein
VILRKDTPVRLNPLCHADYDPRYSLSSKLEARAAVEKHSESITSFRSSNDPSREDSGSCLQALFGEGAISCRGSYH